MRDKKGFVGFSEIIVRYLIVFVLGLGNLYIFYAVLTPLTLYGVGALLGLFSDVILLSNGFMYEEVFFELVSACVGGSAFYLLLILIMGSRDIVWLKRVKMIVFAFLLLYVFNVLRIVFMATLINSNYFDVFHLGLWYFVSTLFVVLIWFLTVWLFEVKSIPVYSDLVYIVGLLKKSYGVGGRGRRVKKKGSVTNIKEIKSKVRKIRKIGKR